jgi:hypothetical protein
MKSMIIFNNQSWSNELGVAQAMDEGYTHFISKSFDDENLAVQFSEQMQNHWRTDWSGLWKMHRKVYGYTITKQWESVNTDGQYVVLVLINAGSDFSELLSAMQIGVVQPLMTSLKKPRPSTRRYIEDWEFGSELSLKGGK